MTKTPAAPAGLVMVDTSAWVDGFRGRTPWVLEMLSQLIDDDRAAICGPVRFEIARGLRPPEKRKVLPLLDALHVIPFQEEDWTAAGDLDASLRARGRTLPAMDLLIAALCLREDMPILTLDTHFEVIDRLRSWREATT